MTRSRPARASAIAWLTVVAMLGPARADGPAIAAVQGWSGTYTCLQGETALDLVLRRGPGNTLRGEFHFMSAPANPGVPEGCFTMKGTLDAKTGHVRLSPGRWLVRPAGYVMIGLEGDIDTARGWFDGEITPAVPGCTRFSLRAVAEPAASPAACHPNAVTAAAPTGVLP